MSLHVRAGTRELSPELQHRTTVEAELRAAQSRYQTLVEINPDAVLVNFNKKIIYANNAAARLRRDGAGRSAWPMPVRFCRAGPQSRSRATLRAALASGQPSQQHIQRRVRLDGSLVDVETVAAPLAWDGGTAVQVIMRDVTEQRRAEALGTRS